MDKMKKIVVSGMQASGNLHLGNYLGALKNWTTLQQDFDCLFFLADLHAITIAKDPQELKNSILSSIAIYLAAGLDPDRSIVFAQNDVPQHTELAWLLNCVTPLGWLKRMTQFKDKSGKDQDGSCLGLFSYPVLMAADILCYNADFVPVGEDQKQHVELVRDIAGIINRKFKSEIFKLPQPIIQGSGTRIMSLNDGRKKMSKSNPSDLSKINLIDSVDLISFKIKRAKTDSISEIYYDPIQRPEISNLINIYSAVTDETIEQIVKSYEGQGFLHFKNDLVEVITSVVNPIRDKYDLLLNNHDCLVKILKDGAIKAEQIAHLTLLNLKDNFGYL